jgi:hypothetical protein
MTAAVTFAVVFTAYLTGHHLGDYWIQTHLQALRKSLPGWAGRRACLAHVASYTLTLAVFLGLAAWGLALPVSPWRAAFGLLVSAGTHYMADRREPLRRIARLIGKEEYWNAGGGLASGASYLDQSWHLVWIFAAALITAGGAS